MLRMMKKDGMIIITCASLGRGEHGTKRTTPENSPLTNNIGWTYYKNLSKRDLKIVPFENWLSTYLLSAGGSNNDLFLVGWGKLSDVEIQNQFKVEIDRILKYRFRSFFLMLINKILGNYLFQELYLILNI